MSEFIDISDDGGIRFITINRTTKKNALTSDMYQAMADAITSATEDRNMRAILLSANGDMFTAGNDLGEFANTPINSSDGELPPVLQFLVALATTDVPVIAAVNGPAVGIGVTMLLHCDLVYAATTATFHTPFIDLGLTPEGASSVLMPSRFGERRAAELLMLGKKIDAARAENFGLVNDVVEPDKLEDTAKTAALELAAKAPGAIRQAKRLLRGDTSLITDTILSESRIFEKRLQSEEFKEAATAFFEKRKPNFS